MILYSIIPAEIVFSEAPASSAGAFMELNYLGETIQATALSDNRYMINRVISTSLKAFLEPRLQPGRIIHAAELE